MATKSNVVIRAYNPFRVISLPVPSSTVVAPGDFIAYSTGGTLSVVSGADNTTFMGIALDGSESGEIGEIAVATECIIYVKNAAGSSTLRAGNAVKYSAGANGTDWEVTKATAEGIMWAWEDSIAAGSYGLFLVDTLQLQADTIFETVTT